MNQDIPDKLRGRLYPVVLGLFSGKDFHKVNLREIASQAAVSTGTIYKHFSSKEDLLFAVLDEKIGEIADLIKLHIAGLENSKEIFRKIFWVTLDYYDRHPEVAVIAFITVPMRTWMKADAYRTEETRALITAIFAAAQKRGDIDPVVKPRIFADIYYMMCYRQIHNWYYHGMQWKLADTGAEYFKLTWKMLAP